MDDDRLLRTLYVGGLEEGVTPQVLHAAFIPFGDLRTVEIPNDKLTGKHRGFGFVEFEEKDDASHAVENMDQSEIYGRVVTVNFARAPSKKVGESSRPEWADDFFYRKKLADAGMTVSDVDLESLTDEMMKKARDNPVA